MPSLSLRTALTACWAALHAAQYGFAITSLNGIQQYVTCADSGEPPSRGTRALEECVSMTSAQFGLVVSIFTLGGLMGSLAANTVTSRYRYTGTLRLSAFMILIGSAALGMANSIGVMIGARILTGIGCGLSTVTIPVFLAEIAPASMKRSLGIMNQVFIVIGMVAAQSLSFPFSEPFIWRYVFIVSFVVAIVQLLGSLLVKETEQDEEGETEPLLGIAEGEPMSIKDLLTSKDKSVVQGFIVVLVTQISQQFCGVAPVMYFSTRILRPVFGDNARLMALIVVAIKIPITTIPAFLIERLGSRSLLVCPTAVMSLAALSLAIGINTDSAGVSIAAMILFVVAFSVGLGPVSWVVLPEVMPKRSVTAAGSVGLAVNWITNFCMGTAFLPLQQWMSAGGGAHEGNIFFVLAATCGMAALAMHAAFAHRAS